MPSAKGKLIEILQNNPDDYIALKNLSQTLHTTESTVLGHIETLRKRGYIIEEVSNKRYRLIHIPEELNSYMIAQNLHTNWLGSSIIYKDSISSTQELAHQEAKNGAAHGAIVIANEQTKGKGRRGRNWHSSKNKGVWMSIVLRPSFAMQQASQITLLTAAVLADVLSHVTSQKITIKWPNDILINHKKIAGVLTEIKTEQKQIKYIAVGIGLNVNQRQTELPSELKQKAASLLMETNQHYNIKSLIQQVLLAFEKSYDAFINQGFTMIKDKWEQYGHRMRQKIRVNTANQCYDAIFSGIDSDGALLVERNGEIEKLYSAEIDWFLNDKE